MSQYRIRIINHTVMGYPYVPICKFQLSSTAKSKHDNMQQSSYVNPPLYNPKVEGKEMQPVSTPSSDSAYMKQFPIDFPLLTFSVSEEVEIKLIELTRNGREKMIGYSKIILNASVLGKNTRHKIIQIGHQAKTSKQGIKNEHVISIVEVNFDIAKKRETSESKKAQIVKQQIVNPFKIQQSNTSRDNSQRSSNAHSDRSKSNDHQLSQQSRHIIFDSSKSFAKSPNQNESYSSIRQPNTLESKDESLDTINKPKHESPPQNSSRRVLRHKPSDSSVESSYPISRQSRVLSNDRFSGKIVRQKPAQKTIEKKIEPIEQAPVQKQTEFKHKRRLKYIFSSSEFGGPVTIEQKTEGLKKKNQNHEEYFEKYQAQSDKVTRRKHLKQMHTQANPTMPVQLVEYFITNDQTNQNGCNALTNINLVYESAFGPFYPKYITFLTHKLYESIIRINCEQLKDKVHNQDSSRSQDQYLLETEEGQLYEPEVYKKFNSLKLYLPKYCLVLRVQIIMQDESVYVGTLNNQVGANIKSTLQLKRSANMQSTQAKKEKERVNMIVNILQNIVQKQMQSPRIQPQDISLPTQNTTKNRGKAKSRFQSERFFPQIAQRLYTEQNKADVYFNYSTLNESRHKNELSPVEKTLHAINSYKNILSPNDDIEKNLQKSTSSPKQRLHRKEYINNQDSYVELQRSFIEPKKVENKTKQIQSHAAVYEMQQIPIQRPNQEPTQEELAELLTSKRTYHRDLPKIMLQRSSKYNLNQARRQTIFQNLQSELAIKTRKRKSSSKHDADFSREKHRLDYFKKVLNNKYGEYVSLNRELQKKLLNISNEKRAHKSRSRDCLQHKFQVKQRKKLLQQRQREVNNTAFIPSTLERSAIKIVSCHDRCIKQMPVAKELKEKKKKNTRSNSSLQSLNNKSKSDFKKIGRFNIMIKKLEYLKIVQNEKGSKIQSTKFKSPGNDSENERWEQSSNGRKEQQPFEVFLKVYSESKRQREFITPSQKLSPAFSHDYYRSKMQSPSQKSLNYMLTSWNVKESDFIFKNIELSDMITVEAYGDMSSLDNHEFMGRCIFTVQEMSYMRIQKKITGYLVRNKKIQSHCTLHFEIEEVL